MRTLRALAAVAVVAASPASAHALRLEVRAEGACLLGKVMYSDGWPGAQEIVRVTDSAKPDADPVTVKAGDKGGFALRVSPGRSYRVAVSGDEEHVVERDVRVASDLVAEPHACAPSPQ